MIYRERVCWFNFSRVIRHRRQHRTPMYLSNPTKNFFVTSFGESEARSTALPIDSSIKERNNPRSSAFSLSRTYERLPRETNSYRCTGPIRSDRGIWSNEAKCRPINRSITDTATVGESVRHSARPPTCGITPLLCDGTRTCAREQLHVYVCLHMRDKGTGISVH